MGYTFAKGMNRQETVNHLTRPSSSTTSQGIFRSTRTLAKSLRGSQLWVVTEVTDRDLSDGTETVENVINLHLLDTYAHGCGYQSFGEEDRPYHYDCPLKYLDMAPVKCQDWRDGVRQRLAEKAAKRQRHKSAQVGEYREVLNADIPWVKIVAVAGRKVHGEYRGTVYNIPPRFMGEVIDPARLQAA